MTDRPDIVCICGSAKFMTEMRAANRELTLTGVIVVAPSEADERAKAATARREAVSSTGVQHRRADCLTPERRRDACSVWGTRHFAPAVMSATPREQPG